MVQIANLLPIVLLAATANAFSISAWSNTGYTGTEFQTSNTGTFDLGFKARSYIWSSPGGDGCCIKFCNGGSETGNWCPSHSNSNVASKNEFNKVVTGCGSTVLNC